MKSWSRQSWGQLPAVCIIFWPLMQSPGPAWNSLGSTVIPQTVSGQSQGHLVQRQQQFTESTLAPTTEELRLSVAASPLIVGARWPWASPSPAVIARVMMCLHSKGSPLQLCAVSGRFPSAPGCLFVVQQQCLLQVKMVLHPHGTPSVSWISNCWEGIYWICWAWPIF